MGGTRDRAAGAIAATFAQWDMSNSPAFTYTSDHTTFFESNDFAREEITAWTATDSAVLDNGGSGTGKYFTGYTLKATRSFGGCPVLNFENKQTYNLGGSTWVTDNKGQGSSNKEQNTGYMDFQINLAVPPPPAPEPEPEPETTETGATALATSAVAAAAILALF